MTRVSRSLAAPLPKVIGFPIGFIDVLTPDRVSGWACDANAGTKALWLHVYIDGKFYDAFEANQVSPPMSSVVARVDAPPADSRGPT